MGWTKFRPIGPKVLVKLDPPPTKVGMIHIPDNCAYQAGASSAVLGSRHGGESLGDRFGTVVAVGTGHWEMGEKKPVHQPMQLREGDRVIFGMYNGIQIAPPDDDPEGEYWVMTTHPMGADINPDVWGILESESEAAQ